MPRCRSERRSSEEDERVVRWVVPRAVSRRARERTSRTVLQRDGDARQLDARVAPVAMRFVAEPESRPGRSRCNATRVGATSGVELLTRVMSIRRMTPMLDGGLTAVIDARHRDASRRIDDEHARRLHPHTSGAGGAIDLAT